MKSLCVLMFNVFFLTLGYSLPNPAHSTTNCREYLASIDETLSPAEQIRQDLIQGTWTSSEVGVADWSFQEDGSLLVVRKDGNGYQVKKASWSVQYYPSATILYLTNFDDRQKLRFLVEQNCAGINLENVDAEETLRLQYQKRGADEYRIVRQSIVGHWEHNLATEIIAQLPVFSASGSTRPVGAKILMDLNSDGTFAQTLFVANQGIRQTQYGKWMLSSNAKFLIVFSQESSEPARCLPIQYLEYDELVLRQLLTTPTLTQEDQGYYFNKM